LQNSETPLLTVAVDNGSTDGTVEILRQKFPEVTVLAQEKNLGFAKANNIGMEFALNRGADFVFLLNQDAWIEPNTVSCLLDTFAKDDKIGIVSPLHLNGEKTGYDKLFAKNCLSEDFFDDEKNGCLKNFYIVPKSNAAAWLIDTGVIRKIGGFDTLLFTHYGEDTNYYQRLAYHGFKLAVCSQTTICHDREDRIQNGILHWGKNEKERERINKYKRCGNINHGFRPNIPRSIRDLTDTVKIFISRRKNKKGGFVWLDGIALHSQKLNWRTVAKNLSILFTAILVVFLFGFFKKMYGFAANTVNTVIFRQNSLATFGDTQFIAYFDGDGFMCLGKRKLGQKKWKIRRTRHKFKTYDAHNCISIMIDGNGFLHASWNQHKSPLNYARSKRPLSLNLGKPQKMTGICETSVTYPQFFKLNDGGLLFFFRDGRSGSGNISVNRYDLENKTWRNLHKNLIDGENLRNAYIQACMDKNGTIHISWVWRETNDAATNHDLCYARSLDGGETWTNSSGQPYSLPITVETAEYAARIPQNTSLINQTSMCTDDDGRVYIATYYKDEHSYSPQYHIVFSDKNGTWHNKNLGFPNIDFFLGGRGTKKLPISRPLVLWKEEKLYLIFREAGRDNKVSIARISGNLHSPKPEIWDLTPYSVEDWEPTYDTELWRERGILNLFVQKARQDIGKGDTNSTLEAQKIEILEVNF
jgi:GT2 family glycosyltransferase